MFEKNNNFYSKTNILKIFIFLVFVIFILATTIYNSIERQSIKKEIENINKKSSQKLEKELYSQAEKTAKELADELSKAIVKDSMGSNRITEQLNSISGKVSGDFTLLKKRNEENEQDNTNRSIFQKVKEYLANDNSPLFRIADNLLKCCNELDRQKGQISEEIQLALSRRQNDSAIEQIINNKQTQQDNINKGRKYLKNMADILNIYFFIKPELSNQFLSDDIDPYKKFLLRKIDSQLGNSLNILAEINRQMIDGRNNNQSDSLPQIFRDLLLSW
ncbi:hypothetical protein ['Camptotheca acuminata' phytoplasma]|uniref:hypothetical protein n=1 Tax='Camptotheca acuminata' phytoplasma TaxID=3239192 RepID=UPI00351A4DCA